MSHSAVKNPGASAICGEYTRAYSTTPFEGRVLDFFLSIYAGLLAHLGKTRLQTLEDLRTALESAGFAIWRGCIPGSLGDHFVVNPYSIEALSAALQAANGDQNKFDWKIRRGVLDSMIGALCVSPFEIDEDIEGNRIPLELQCQILDGAVADGMLPPNALVLSGDSRPPALCAGYHNFVAGKSVHAHFGYLPLDPQNTSHRALRKEINELLVATFHSDPMVGNAGRVMRVGGAVAWDQGFSPSEVPRVQTLLSSHDQIYHAEEVRDSLRRVVEVRGIDVAATLAYQAEQRRQRLAATRTSSPPPGTSTSPKGNKTRTRSGCRKKGRARSPAIWVFDTRNKGGEFELSTQEVQLAKNNFTTKIKDVVTALPSWEVQRCHCPFHRDDSPSAFISVTEKGTPYLVCSSGCGTSWPQRTVEGDLLVDLAVLEPPPSPPMPQQPPSASADQKESTTDQPAQQSAKTFFPKLKPLLRPDTRLLFLRGPMGSGKTYAEVEIARNLERVLGLTSRRALVREAARRFGGAIHEDVNGPLLQKRVWACINSTMRVPDFTEEFELIERDLLIIAEGEQTYKNLFTSVLVGEESGHIYERLRSIIRNTKLIIIDDAFLSPEAIAFFTRLCGVSEEQVQIINHGTPDISQEIIKFSSWEDAVNSAIKSIEREERCYISVTSKAMAKKLERKIKRLFSDREVRVYHSDIDEETRKELEDVNLAWAEVDVVIASPTIASGVSFDLEDHFDRVYLLASSVKGITWSDLLQQVGRVRHPRLNKLFIWVAPTTFYDCTERELVKKRLVRFLEQTKEAATLLDLRIERNKEGKPEAHPLNEEHFEGYLDQLIVTRRRSNRVADSLFAWWRHWGNPITTAAALSEGNRKAIRKEFKELRLEIEEEEVKAVADAEDISIEHALAIEDHGAQNQEESSAAEKARIKNFYGEVTEPLIAQEKHHRPSLSKTIRERVNLALAVEGKEEELHHPDVNGILTGFDANIPLAALKAKVIQKIIEASPIPVESLVEGLRIPQDDFTEQVTSHSTSTSPSSSGEAISAPTSDFSNNNKEIGLSHLKLSHPNSLETDPVKEGGATDQLSPPRAEVEWSNAHLLEGGFVDAMFELNEQNNFRELLGVSLPRDFSTNPNHFLGRILAKLGIKTIGREVRKDGGKMRVYTVDWEHLERIDRLSWRHNRRRRGLWVEDVFGVEEEMTEHPVSTDKEGGEPPNGEPAGALWKAESGEEQLQISLENPPG